MSTADCSRWLRWASSSSATFPNSLTYLLHRLTNAGMEAVNATIQRVKKTAKGFGNVEHIKTAICFHFGGLDL